MFSENVDPFVPLFAQNFYIPVRSANDLNDSLVQLNCLCKLTELAILCKFNVYVLRSKLLILGANSRWLRLR